MTRTEKTLLTLAVLAATVALPASPLPAADATDAFDALMGPYGEIHQALAADSLDRVPTAAEDLAEEVRSLEKDLTPERAAVDESDLAAVKEHLAAAAEAAGSLAKTETLEDARSAFGDLSTALVAWRELAGAGPAVGFCPMAKKAWLETDTETLENPYYGQSMLRCGSFQAK